MVPERVRSNATDPKSGRNRANGRCFPASYRSDFMEEEEWRTRRDSNS